jgi:hypothetical protein
MFDFKDMSRLLDEMTNVSVAINAYESPARPFKKNVPVKKKKINWNKMLQKQKARRGE